MPYHWLLFLFLITPIQASAFSAMQMEDCVAAWQVINKGRETGANIHRRSHDGWCLLPENVPAAAAIKGFDFDRIEWRAEGLERLLSQSLPPTALAIRVTDADMLRKLGGRADGNFPVIPMQIELVLRENAKERQLVIGNLTVLGPKENAVRLRGVFHDVDLSSLVRMQNSLGTAKLRDVTIEATGNRKLESYLRPYIGTTFPERSRKRSAMIDKVSDWPERNFPRATKRAVQQLIAALPTPHGNLRVKVDTGAGLSVSLLVQTVLFGGAVKERVPQILAGTIFRATWTVAE